MSIASRHAQLGRLHLLSAVLAGVGALLAFRLYSVQVKEHERFAAMAHEERFQTSTIPSRRGALLDANGYPLAISVPYASVEVVGAEVRDPIQTAGTLAPLLGMRPDD